MKFIPICALAFTSVLVHAQNADAFLVCAEINDRLARVICLEEALDEATRQSPESEIQGTVIQEQDNQVTEVENFGNSPDTSDSGVTPEISSQPAQVSDVEENTSRLPRFRLPGIRNPFRRGDNEDESDAQDVQDGVAIESESDQSEQLADFGRQSRIVINENGEDELNDVVVELDMVRPDQWMVTLASGQVWRQTHPRRLNLRKGDAVKIYPSGWGENFRLEAERLSGFIQVLRVE